MIPKEIKKIYIYRLHYGEVRGDVLNNGKVPITDIQNCFKMVNRNNYMMRNARKRPLYNLQTTLVQISMRIRRVLSEHFLYIDIYYSIHWFCKGTMKALISLRLCAGWSGPALSANCRCSFCALRITFTVWFGVGGVFNLFYAIATSPLITPFCYMYRFMCLNISYWEANIVESIRPSGSTLFAQSGLSIQKLRVNTVHF